MKTDGVFPAVHPTTSRPFCLKLRGEKKATGFANFLSQPVRGFLMRGLLTLPKEERGGGGCSKLKSARDGIDSYSDTTLEKREGRRGGRRDKRRGQKSPGTFGEKRH